jgi:hypothetical protein
MLIVGQNFLDSQDRSNLPPGSVETVRCGRKLVLDCTVQRHKVIARHGGIHVMLSVVVHVPVHEFHEWVDCERAAAKPKIRYIIL